MVDAIILAGAENLQKEADAVNKALLSIRGRCMIEYVVDALEHCEHVDKILVVGPGEPLRNQLQGWVTVIESEQGTILENLKKGVDCLRSERRLLICTCDIPFITAESIRDFVVRAAESQADLCYPIIDKKMNDLKFPGIRRTYVKLGDGMFTGGNVFYLNPVIIDRGIESAEKLLQARKKPLTMAGFFGIRFLLQFVTGKLTVEKIERKFSELFDIKGKAIISQYPEIGNDVDRTEDILYAEKYFPTSM